MATFEKSNLQKLQDCWRQDEYALRAVFGEDSFYQVLLSSWPEDKKQVYVNQINKKYNKEIITTKDLHIAEEKNGMSHIYVKEMKKDDNGLKQFVASHFIRYSKTLRRNPNTNETVIDIQKQNLINWQGSDFICFVWKYSKGDMRVLCYTKKLIKYLIEKGEKHTEKNQSFISCTLKEAILNNLVKAYWDTKVVDPDTHSFDLFKYEVTLLDNGIINVVVPKRKSALFDKVDISSRQYTNAVKHKGGTKLYFPNGEIKHYELQKDALEDICTFMAANNMPYSNNEKDKMKLSLKRFVQRSNLKIENMKAGKIDAKDNSFMKTSIYIFSGDISNEDITSFMEAKLRAISEKLSGHFVTLVNKSASKEKEKESSMILNYYLKGHEVPDNTLAKNQLALYLSILKYKNSYKKIGGIYDN